MVSLKGLANLSSLTRLGNDFELVTDKVLTTG